MTLVDEVSCWAGLTAERAENQRRKVPQASDKIKSRK